MLAKKPLNSLRPSLNSPKAEDLFLKICTALTCMSMAKPVICHFAFKEKAAKPDRLEGEKEATHTLNINGKAFNFNAYNENNVLGKY